MRRLTLRSESLAELSADELSGVAGGATQLCPTHQATLCYLCNLLSNAICP
ncbi:MAG TPA: hypothetical protein VGX28_06575 [Frankiaceae bacterium]|jgi:hypothetical protein|nr:hypothetical protein [Frankiaceae bacterium]